MPANFQATYTPISVAGTEQQIAHLSRLMATQMTAQNLGKGVEEMMKKAQLEMIKSEVRLAGYFGRLDFRFLVIGVGTRSAGSTLLLEAFVVDVPGGTNADRDDRTRKRSVFLKRAKCVAEIASR